LLEHTGASNYCRLVLLKWWEVVVMVFLGVVNFDLGSSSDATEISWFAVGFWVKKLLVFDCSPFGVESIKLTIEVNGVNDGLEIFHEFLKVYLSVAFKVCAHGCCYYFFFGQAKRSAVTQTLSILWEVKSTILISVELLEQPEKFKLVELFGALVLLFYFTFVNFKQFILLNLAFKSIVCVNELLADLGILLITNHAFAVAITASKHNLDLERSKLNLLASL